MNGLGMEATFTFRISLEHFFCFVSAGFYLNSGTSDVFSFGIPVLENICHYFITFFYSYLILGPM